MTSDNNICLQSLTIFSRFIMVVLERKPQADSHWGVNALDKSIWPALEIWFVLHMPKMRGSRGWTRGPDPPEKSQNTGFFCNTGSDALKKHNIRIHKATKPAFNVRPS